MIPVQFLNSQSLKHLNICGGSEVIILNTSIYFNVKES